MSSLGLYPVFHQYTRGSFSIAVVGDYHCGPNHDSPKDFEYEVTTHYSNDALDQDGFLQDNLLFIKTCKEYFGDLGVTDLSCELLARQTAIALCQRSPELCKGVKVAIWPISNMIKVEYLHPKD